MSGDQFWNQTISLLHFDVDFTDEKGNTAWETTNGAFITSDNDPVWGNRLGSDGSSNIASNSGWDSNPLQHDNFTVELRYTPSVVNDSSGLWSWGSTADNDNRVYLRQTATGGLAFLRRVNAVTTFLVESASGLLVAGVESVIQAQCKGTTALIRHNGVEVASAAYTPDPWIGPNFNKIGIVNAGGTFYASGPIDEFRLTNTIRYQTDYTPATAPFPDGPIVDIESEHFPSYPKTFPCPSWSYNESDTQFAARTDYDCGWTRQRRKWPGDSQNGASISFVMDAYMFHKWSTWIDANSPTWFYMEIDSVVETVRLIAGPSYQYDNFDRISASISVEVRA